MYYIEQLYSVHPLLIHSPGMKCGQSSDCLTTETGTRICRVIFRTEQNDCSGSLNIFLWTEKKEQEEREGVWGLGSRKGERDKKKKKKKIQRHKTGIKPNIAQSYCQILNDREVKGIYWRTYYIISPWRHTGDDERCQKSEGRYCLFLHTEKVIEERKQGNVSVYMTH